MSRCCNWSVGIVFVKREDETVVFMADESALPDTPEYRSNSFIAIRNHFSLITAFKFVPNAFFTLFLQIVLHFVLLKHSLMNAKQIWLP